VVVVVASTGSATVVAAVVVVVVVVASTGSATMVAAVVVVVASTGSVTVVAPVAELVEAISPVAELVEATVVVVGGGACRGSVAYKMSRVFVFPVKVLTLPRVIACYEKENRIGVHFFFVGERVVFSLEHGHGVVRMVFR
jgi:hypothetical protein